MELLNNQDKNPSDDIPEYSDDGLFNYSILFGSSVDLLIYIEDTTIINVYEILLDRILGSQIKFENIIATGGKPQLIELYKKTLEESTKTSCLFIADLDFDLLLDKCMIKDTNFVYLNRYSIENYLVDYLPGAIFLNGRECIGIEQSVKRINFENWTLDIQEQYKPLVIMFATIQSLGLGVRNCKLPAERFMKDKGYNIDAEKVKSYYKEVIKECQKTGTYGLIQTYNSIKNRISENYNLNLWLIIPGKQLLATFVRYLTHFTKTKQVILDDFINLAAINCRIEELTFIRDTVEKILGRKITIQNSDLLIADVAATSEKH